MYVCMYFPSDDDLRDVGEGPECTVFPYLG